MRRWWPWLLLVLALVPALLISKPKQPQVAVPNNRVSEAIFQNPATLDPALADNPSEWAVTMNVFDTLYQVTSSGQVMPNLVSHASMSNKTLTLTIRPKRLPNGQTLSASVVAGALSRPLWPEVGSSQAKALLAHVQGAAQVEHNKLPYLSGVAVVNPDTVSITFTKPVTSAFLKALANPALAIVPVTDEKRGGAYWQLSNLFGSGGYRLTNWVPNGSLSFRRFSGHGPAHVQLTEYSSFQEALLAFENQVVDLVPVDPGQLSKIPQKLLKDVRALAVPGNLELVYRPHAANISTYPAVSPAAWVKSTFRDRIPSLHGNWPSGVRHGRKLVLYVNAGQPEAVLLADRLAKLRPGKVIVRAVSGTSLQALAKGNKIGAYIGQVNWFKNGAVMPLAPLRSLWLVNPAIQAPQAFFNGTLDWHSLTLRP
ncbi:ABC transporter substrate-binding protein [Sulfobacillus harzensis]|uniref:ABC transporter substrate-binding protein n=1 Tax=Sulfobacillus harzensis TaxID=2729629 RepID=A0A7Y0L4C1_9FIRM|nr:ABC transporter substrate-binding protein [Sulfobacillus harzensis]NMP22843.1 ABC transporter substrate-binding protein [Sulfobacillus harzensis]